mgnify:FL=1
MSEKLFVYGTLRLNGGSNHLLGEAQLIGEATTKGVLYDMEAFPALVREEGVVKGEVWEVPGTLLGALDYYEGAPELYVRHKFPVEVVVGSVVVEMLAWVYVYQLSVEGLKWIESGDWVEERGG